MPDELYQYSIAVDTQAVDLAKKTDRSLNGQMVQLMKLGVAQLAPNNEAKKQADLKDKDRA